MRDFCRSCLYTLFLVLISLQSYGQSVRSFDSDWLSGKSGQTFVKITVSKTGLSRIPFSSLPQGVIISDPSTIELWHRGKQISIISTSNNEILFYAVSNDGDRDKYLYRNESFQPDSTARLNPYHSWFSDDSAYFLTLGKSTGKRAPLVSEALDPSIANELFHLQSHLEVYSEEYSHSAEVNLSTPVLVQSFFEGGKGMTGKRYGKHINQTRPTVLGDWVSHLRLPDYYPNSGILPTVEYLIYGRTFGENNIKAEIGKDSSSLRVYDGGVKIKGFGAAKRVFTINTSSDPGKSDISASGEVSFKLSSLNITDTWSTTGIFSLSFFKVNYPQQITMRDLNTVVFNLPGNSAKKSRVMIQKANANAKVFDITDYRAVKQIQTNFIDGALQVMLPREQGKLLRLLVTNEINEIKPAQILPVSLVVPDPKSYDYLIVTSDELLNVAKEYAEYRRSTQGGTYRPLVMNIKDIYNVFNYGEPSPMAIRSFVDFMISNGVSNKHNLLLIGHSTTYGDKLKINKDISGQVPTVGYPGSDLLLVTGLKGFEANSPAIPVGRISALTVEDLKNYLAKVKDYESNAEKSEGWKKSILHLSGGKSGSEIIELKNALQQLAPVVVNGELGGEVKVFQKQSAIEVEKVNITPEVNEGVGMISYLGHGSPTITDLDMGYASDAARGYNNTNKYPLMYFNGCGVGNIFRGNINRDINASDRLPLSFDWMYTKNKGSIALIANSYYSFLSSSSRYLTRLYNEIFSNSSDENNSIGQMQVRVVNKIIGESYGEYDISNMHQSVLQGDPAVKVLRIALPDFTFHSNLPVRISSDSPNISIRDSKNINVTIVASNRGRFVSSQEVSFKVRLIYRDGQSSSLVHKVKSLANVDTIRLSFENRQSLQAVEVNADVDNLLEESNEVNNESILDVEWDIAKDLSSYPGQPAKDLISPILLMKSGGSIVKERSNFSSSSAFNIILTDNALLSSDTSSLEVFLKRCWGEDCKFNKISFASGDLLVGERSSRSLVVNYSLEKLTPGEYEILVNGRDAFGNVVIKPYRINFMIEDGEFFRVVASPNPATNYVRFEFGVNSLRADESFELSIYSHDGKLIKQKSFKDAQSEWYWNEVLQPGLFVYKVLKQTADGRKLVGSGKIVVAR